MVHLLIQGSSGEGRNCAGEAKRSPLPSDFNLINIVKEIGGQQRSEALAVSAASLVSHAVIYEVWINNYKRLKSYDQEKYA